MEKDEFLSYLRHPDVRAALSETVLKHWSREGISVKYCILPGGRTPERATEGAVGFDMYARAIVDARVMDAANPHLRKTLFDFKNYPEDARLRSHVHTEIEADGSPKFSWILRPGDHVLVGVGVAFALPYELFQWVTPRSGLASKHRIQLGNAPGTIDSDYRGEAGVIVVNDGDDDFIIDHHMRIAQLLFQPVLIPKLCQVANHDDLGKTERGAGGFGSTGYNSVTP